MASADLLKSKSNYFVKKPYKQLKKDNSITTRYNSLQQN